MDYIEKDYLFLYKLLTTNFFADNIQLFYKLPYIYLSNSFSQKGFPKVSN